MTSELRYIVKGFSVDDLSTELDRLWQELKKESKLRAQAEAAGIDLKALQTMGRGQAITARREGEGLDPATSAVVIAFAPVVAKIVADLWTHVLLPRIRQARGADAITPKPNSS